MADRPAGCGVRVVEIFPALVAQTGLAHVVGLCGLTAGLPLVGRSGEAIAIADDTITAHQAGNTPNLTSTFASLAVLFDRIDVPEIAAIIYGATTPYPTTSQTLGLAAAVDHLHHALDAETFDDCVRAGAAMNLTEAVHYAHHHISTTRQHQR